MTQIPYKHQNFVIGLTAMISNLGKKLQNLVPDLPVFVLDTGDETYFNNIKFKISNNKDINLKVPRFVLAVDEAELQGEQNTNQFNTMVYKLDDEVYQTKARRQAFQFTINATFVASNFIKALEYLEMLTSLMSCDNVFTYESLGNTFEGNYTSGSFTMTKNPSATPDSGTRNFIITVPLSVTLQPMFIRYETIKKENENGVFLTVFEINVFDPLYVDGMDDRDPTNIKYDKNNPDKR